MIELIQLGKDKADNSKHIVREITGQPSLWMDTFREILSRKKEIDVFLDAVFENKDLQIILTGAGSSAFIGEILAQAFYKHFGKSTNAIPTTDLVTHPTGYFDKKTPTLLVSFARSGNSPESIATFELAEKLHDKVYHFIITCNKEGNLVKKAANSPNAYIFLLPDQANDLALAMTGSFTSMTLAGLLISNIKNISKNEETVKRLSKFGNTILKYAQTGFKMIAEHDFKRVVFLGAGALKGAAKESHLKVLEMTDGQILCQYDSFLGFRHGPRAGIDSSTLLVYLFSSDPYVYKYEIDLVKSISETEDFLLSIGIGQRLFESDNLGLDLTIDLYDEYDRMSDEYFSICGVVPAQIIGLYKSISLGLIPDSPSQNGGINRTVQGVTIYPY
jgi:tagatose-6-phosphate ketose/aldose isomerase